MELADREDVVLLGVTDATAAEVRAYRKDKGLDFAILAEAAEAREAWGVRLIWGNAVRLVNPEGKTVAEGKADAERYLVKRNEP